MLKTFTQGLSLLVVFLLTTFSTTALANSTEDTGGYCYGNQRSLIVVENKSNCVTKVYCHEESADNKVYYMGYLHPGRSMYLRPSAKKARIFTVTDGEETASLKTTKCGQRKTLKTTSCGATCKGKIDELVLYKSGNFQKIATLKDGETYYLDEINTNFGMEAIIDGQIGSVAFEVNGHKITENIFHYTYPAGDGVWHPSEGSYRIKATAYYGSNKGGKKCSTKEITIKFKKKNACKALTTGGKIRATQTNCGAFDPVPFIGDRINDPNGGSVSYQWQVKEDKNGSWKNIPNATHKDYDPPYQASGSIWYRRIVKNACSSKASNSVDIHVKKCEDECKGSIKEVVFYKSGNFQKIATIEDGGVYYLSELPNKFGIETLIDGKIESIAYQVNGHNITENIFHYTYPAGDAAWNPTPGHYTLKATAYSRDHKKGKVCDHVTIRFEIKKERCTGQITGIKFNSLSNGDSDVEITDGGVYLSGELPASFNIEAMGSGKFQSIRFKLSGDKTDQHTENYAPYRFIGDNNPLNLDPGKYTLKVSIFSKDKAKGELCDEETVHFEIVECEKQTPGSACDDGNPETVNDVVTEDGCGCAGECPEITPEGPTEFTICDGDRITFDVSTNGPVDPFAAIAWVIFDSPQSNPYDSEDEYIYLGEVANGPGVLSRTRTWNTAGSGTFYVYACFKPEPTTEGCVPFIEYEVTVLPDSDEDGICDIDDCKPQDPNFPATPGTPCDDGNNETINDVIGPDGCACMGECPEIFPEGPTEFTLCDGDQITFDVSTNGPVDPFGGIAWVIFDAQQSNPYDTEDEYIYLGEVANGPGVLTRTRRWNTAGPGTFYVYACFKPEPTTEGCAPFIEYLVTVLPDSDEDGICDVDDCQPQDPNFPATPGSPCDDGNKETINDVVSPDGCECMGECPEIFPEGPTEFTLCDGDQITFDVSTNGPVDPFGGIAWVIFDSQQSNPYDTEDEYIYLGEVASGPGVLTRTRRWNTAGPGTFYVYACFKPEPTTEGCIPFIEYLVTVLPDSDDDGICDVDDCKPQDPNFPASPGSACDDGNKETINDAVTDDGCDCAGECPEIIAEGPTEFNICDGDRFVFDVSSTGPVDPFTGVAWVIFDSPQENPYTSTDPYIYIGEVANGPGILTRQRTWNQAGPGTFYVYACYKPEPTTEDCAPFVQYIFNVEDCSTPYIDNGANTENAVSNSTAAPFGNNNLVIENQNVAAQSVANSLNTGLKVYQNTPNPFDRSTEIAFELPQSGNVALFLTDLSGRSIKVQEAQFNSGYNKIKLNRDRLQAGIYYYTLQTALGSVTKKLVILD